MASISSTSTGGASPAAVVPAAPAPAPATPERPGGQPLYLANMSAQTTAAALGLASPRGLGDLEAMFAEISAKLDQTEKRTEGLADDARTASRSTDLVNAARSLLTLIALAVQIDTARQEIAQLEREVDQLSTEVDGLKSERSGLVSERDSLVSQANSARDERTALDLGIVGKQLELLVTDPNSARASTLRTEIAQDTARSNELLAFINQTQPRIDTLNGRITELDFEILGKEIELGVKETALDVANLFVTDTSNSLASLLLSLLPFALFLALGARKEAGQDSFTVSPTDLEIDEVLKDAIERIADREIDETERRQLAEGLADALPAGTGNPNAVIDRAAGFAGSIAVLQNALQQVVFGNSASTTNLPEVSGRLRFLV